MVTRKPRVVIIGAGMAGLTAANRFYSAAGSPELFEICVVEGGTRIGGRIRTSEFGGDRIEMGATWIHGIGGSPVHKIAQEINSLVSDQPWECMNGFSDDPLTVAEGGYELSPCFVKPVSCYFNKLMEFAQGKVIEEEGGLSSEESEYIRLAAEAFKASSRNGDPKKLSIGSFLRQGLEAYWNSLSPEEELKGFGYWTRKSLEESVFAIHENTQRTYTSAGDLQRLDFNAEREYKMFPGEEITIAKGYTSIIESIASVLPPGSIQLGRKVTRIQWRPEENNHSGEGQNEIIRPVKLHFSDGSVLPADHVIVTVSLGVLKAGIGLGSGSGLFDPPLPSFKTQAIRRLGFGVVNKLFLQLSPYHKREGGDFAKFPFLQTAFHRPDSELRRTEIPWWMRRTASVCPIYGKSSVLLSWFSGKEALELESLEDEEIIKGVTKTISSFLPSPKQIKVSSYSHELSNGHVDSDFKFSKVLKTQWGSDPLFLGSYSYVEVGSSGEDLDTMAVPLPQNSSFLGSNGSSSSSSSSSSSFSSPSSCSPPLQILFAGEATHRTHYSTTHGAYFSGLREANRLLKHYGL